MYPVKRISAYLIDLGIILFLVSIVNGINVIDLVQAFAYGIASFEVQSPFMLILTLLLPIGCNGFLVGILGWTPGKRLMNLRVRNETGTPIGIGKGLLREAVKCAAISFLMFGLAWALYGMYTHRQTFYDKWFSLSVSDETPVSLTDTQKSWREYHREK